MGVVQLPNMHMYWLHNAVFGSPRVFTKEVMSRNRFLSIFKFLRFSSAATVKKNVLWTRIEPFLDLMRDRCRAIMEPGEDVAVDEALILWKGRLGFRQFIKTKRACFGIKVFVLCPLWWPLGWIFLEFCCLLWQRGLQNWWSSSREPQHFRRQSYIWWRTY